MFQPVVVLVFAFIGILWACYPLLTIPVYSGDAKIWSHDHIQAGDRPRSVGTVHVCSKPVFLCSRWADTKPVAFIQQIIIKAAVHPYTDQLIRSDAFRGPLATAFKLHLSDIAEYYDRCEDNSSEAITELDLVATGIQNMAHSSCCLCFKAQI